jgi:KUP system potassium uptake protein
MDMPSRAPVGGPAGLSVQSLGPSQPGAVPDHANYLHHAGSPAFLALTALGVVYGDIGTSPLYAFQVALSGIGHAVPAAAEVLGIVSLIFWALMAMVSLKYVIFVLRADYDGEGGILALLSLVAADRVAEGARLPILVLLGVIGASLLYGDGVITPAISVLSAMEGLKLVAPGFEKFIVPVTLAILIGLFVIQRRGTESIGKLFGPVMVVWFAVIGMLGATNIWTAPAILQAVNPAHAGRFLIADPNISFAVIGAVFLALTGGEALYADMGHVGPAAIRRAWFGLVLPALILNYFGQGALILADPAAADNPFYKLAPGLGADPDGGAGGVRHHHRVAIADLRGVLADAAGDADGTIPARADRADIGG